MKRSLVFARRNLKEIIRDPLSLIFNFIFPIALLVLFFCFVFGKNEGAILKQTPMFAPNKIVPAIAYFGFTFLTLFVGMLVSKDRASSFTSRLKSSPLKAYEVFLGYAIPMVIIAIIQILSVLLHSACLLSNSLVHLIAEGVFNHSAEICILVTVTSKIHSVVISRR